MGLMGRRHVTPAGTTGYTTEKAGSRKPPRHAHPLPGVKGGNWCTKSFPIFADLAEDYVHDRWIVALGFLLIFTILVLPLSGFGYEAPVSVPDKLTELVPMEDILNLNVLGGDMNVKVGRALRIHCLDDDGVGMKNQRVDVAIKNVLILDPAGTLDCNTATQELLRDTIEGENMREACRPHLSASPPVPSFVPAEDVVPGPATAHSNYTDELGIVIYQTLEARSGPPGLYELNISATGGGVTADKVVSVQVTTNVSRILIDETNQVGMAPYTVEIGQPIRTRTGATPVVYVQDSKGSPVTGRRVVAFAHHSDNFFRRDTYLDGAQEPEYHYHVGSGQKETILSGHISETSNIHGAAVFPDLRITAAASQAVYIMFYCEGHILSWTNPLAKATFREAFSNGLPTYFPPIYVNTAVSQVTVLGGRLSGNDIVEGQSFPPDQQPIIIVKDAQGNPLANKRVIAALDTRANISAPFRLPDLMDTSSSRHDTRKRLVNAVSAVTGADGIARFSSLGFQQIGPAGTALGPARYQINYWCDGVGLVDRQNETHRTSLSLVTVRTSVTSVLVKTMNIAVHSNVIGKPSVPDMTRITLQAVDASGKGVQGKRFGRVEICEKEINNTAPATGGPSGNCNQTTAAGLLTSLGHNHKEIQITGKDGFVVIPIAFSFLPETAFKGTLHLRFEIDGVFSEYTDSIQLLSGTPTSLPRLVCSTIEVERRFTLNKSVSIAGDATGSGYTEKIQVKDQYGQPAAGRFVLRRRLRSYMNLPGKPLKVDEGLYTFKALTNPDQVKAPGQFGISGSVCGKCPPPAAVPAVPVTAVDALCLACESMYPGSSNNPNVLRTQPLPAGSEDAVTFLYPGVVEPPLKMSPMWRAFYNAYGAKESNPSDLDVPVEETFPTTVTDNTGRSITFASIRSGPSATMAITYESYLCDNLNLQFDSTAGAQYPDETRRALCTAAGCNSQTRPNGVYCDLRGVENTATRCASDEGLVDVYNFVEGIELNMNNPATANSVVSKKGKEYYGVGVASDGNTGGAYRDPGYANFSRTIHLQMQPQISGGRTASDLAWLSPVLNVLHTPDYLNPALFADARKTWASNSLGACMNIDIATDPAGVPQVEFNFLPSEFIADPEGTTRGNNFECMARHPTARNPDTITSANPAGDFYEVPGRRPPMVSAGVTTTAGGGMYQYGQFIQNYFKMTFRAPDSMVSGTSPGGTFRGIYQTYADLYSFNTTGKLRLPQPSGILGNLIDSNDGTLSLDFEVGEGIPGDYVFSISYGGIAMPPFHIYVPSAAKTLEIVQQPATFGNQPLSLGDLLWKQPVVKVTDVAGNPLPGYTVSAVWVNDDVSPAPVISDIQRMERGARPNELLWANSDVCETGRSAPANATGHAVFGKLAILDGLTGCYRLVFRVWAGHRRRRNGLIDNFHDCRSAQPLSNEVSCTAASVPSVPICLVNDMNVVISQQPSQYATRSILLQQPLSATVQFASRRRQQTPPYLQWTRGFTYSTGYSFTTIVVDNYAKSRKTIWPNEFPPGSAFTGWEVSNQIATGRDCMTRPASTGVSSTAVGCESNLGLNAKHYMCMYDYPSDAQNKMERIWDWAEANDLSGAAGSPYNQSLYPGQVYCKSQCRLATGAYTDVTDVAAVNVEAHLSLAMHNGFFTLDDIFNKPDTQYLAEIAAGMDATGRFMVSPQCNALGGTLVGVSTASSTTETELTGLTDRLRTPYQGYTRFDQFRWRLFEDKDKINFRSYGAAVESTPYAYNTRDFPVTSDISTMCNGPASLGTAGDCCDSNAQCDGSRGYYCNTFRRYCTNTCDMNAGSDAARNAPCEPGFGPTAEPLCDSSFISPTIEPPLLAMLSPFGWTSQTPLSSCQYSKKVGFAFGEFCMTCKVGSTNDPAKESLYAVLGMKPWSGSAMPNDTIASLQGNVNVQDQVNDDFARACQTGTGQVELSSTDCNANNANICAGVGLNAADNPAKRANVTTSQVCSLLGTTDIRAFTGMVGANCGQNAKTTMSCRSLTVADMERNILQVPLQGQTNVYLNMQSTLNSQATALRNVNTSFGQTLELACTVPGLSATCANVGTPRLARAMETLCSVSTRASSRCTEGFTVGEVTDAVVSAGRTGNPTAALRTLIQAPTLGSTGAAAGGRNAPAPLFNAMTSAVTQDVEASVTPAAIAITLQPPAQVTVGELFRVVVTLTISNGAVVPFRSVTAYIGDETNMFETPTTMIATTSGQPSSDFVKEWSTPVLDPDRISVYSDAAGRAVFTLRVLRGAQQRMTVYFKSGSLRSVKTTLISLINPVKEVRWITPDGQPPTLTLFQDAALFTPKKPSFPYIQRIEDYAPYFQPVVEQTQPRLQLFDKNGRPTAPALGSVEIKFVPSLKTEALDRAVENVLDNGSLFSDNWDKMSAFEQFNWFMTLLTQGARRLNVVPLPKAKIEGCWGACRRYETYDDCVADPLCKWDGPAAVDDSGFCIDRQAEGTASNGVGYGPPRNAQTCRPPAPYEGGPVDPQNHAFARDATGTRSLIDFKDLVFEVKKTGTYTFSVLVDGIPSNFTGDVIFEVMDTKSWWFRVRLGLFKALVITVVCLILLGNSAWHDPMWSLASLVVAAVTCGLAPYIGEGETYLIIMIYVISGVMILQLLMVTISMVFRDGKGFFSREYSFASKQRRAQRTYVQQIFEELEDLRVNNPQPALQLRISKLIKSRYQEELEEKERKEAEKQRKKEEKKARRKSKVKPPPKPKKKRREQALFIPTRMIIADLISYITLFSAFFVCLRLQEGMYAAVLRLAATSIQTMYLGIGKLTDQAKKLLGQEIFDDELLSVYDITRVLGDEMRAFALAVRGSFTFAFVITFIIFLAQQYWMGKAFKTKVLNARKGKFDFKVKKHKMADAVNYVGVTISNAIVIFLVFSLILTLLALVLAWHVTRNILFSRTIWVRLIIPMVVPMVVNIVLKKIWVYNIITKQSGPLGDRLLKRRWFHLYDIIMIVFRLFTGPITALIRLFMGVGIAFATLPRMDVSPLPGWFERYMLLDMGSKGFHSMIILYHRLCNPVVNVAVELWWDGTVRRKNAANDMTRHDAALPMEGIISERAWTKDEKYAAGHQLYVQMVQDGRSFTPLDRWAGDAEQREIKNPKKHAVGPQRWHLAVMLVRVPSLREFRVFKDADRGKRDKIKGNGGGDETKESKAEEREEKHSKAVAILPTPEDADLASNPAHEKDEKMEPNPAPSAPSAPSSLAAAAPTISAPPVAEAIPMSEDGGETREV